MFNERTNELLFTLLLVGDFLFGIHVLGQSNGYAPKNSIGLKPQEIGSDYVTVQWNSTLPEDIIYLSYKLMCQLRNMVGHGLLESIIYLLLDREQFSSMLHLISFVGVRSATLTRSNTGHEKELERLFLRFC
ncbi:hypothetical protein AHF37_07451 [Paragonimus kellicotti]|nr:hypothetical protein AHF37_07451 [Paragonimus kellicotti]